MSLKTSKELMEKRIKIGITQGDINGIGYELVFKTFSEPTLLDMYTPIIYGSPKVATFHRKALEMNVNFTTINSAANAVDGKLNIVTCFDEEVKIELGKPSETAGTAALLALEFAMREYEHGLFDVLVTAPVNLETMHNNAIRFLGNEDYLQSKFGDDYSSLTILLNRNLRIGLLTGKMAVKDVPEAITKELIVEKATVFHESLKHDFLIDNPRIAIIALNPTTGISDSNGREETEQIIPAIGELRDSGLQCFGPYAADSFFSSEDIWKFDGVLAMYYDQGMIPFRTFGMFEGVSYVAGLPLVCAAPVHGVGYEVAGKNMADEAGFRNAIYLVSDILRNRRVDDYAHRNPLPKLYTAKHDDSDKLNLEKEEETE